MWTVEVLDLVWFVLLSKLLTMSSLAESVSPSRSGFVWTVDVLVLVLLDFTTEDRPSCVDIAD